MYHATPAENLPSILRRGLLKARSKGRLKAVWAVPAAGIPWACMHVAWKHGVPITDVVVIEMDVPKSWLRRSQRNLYWMPCDVSPERFGGMSTFALVARRGKHASGSNGRKPRGV